MKRITVHLVSDLSGQTVRQVAETSLAQFKDIEIKKYIWPMTNSKSALDEVISFIRHKPGIIIYTISSKELRRMIIKEAQALKIHCVSAVSGVIDALSEHIGANIDKSLSSHYKLDENYFRRIEAIDFSLRHDDGQMLEEVNQADIVLLGPSRSSKTPTSVILACNGFKTANIPIVHQMPVTEIIANISGPEVFGLIVNPSRLMEIRESRVNVIGMREKSDYTNPKIILEECRQVRQIALKYGWNIVDVSSKSIEETSAIITKKYYERKKKQNI